jgi:integrase
LADDALDYSKARKPLSYRDDKYRMKNVREKFGNRVAEEIKPLEIEEWLNFREEWKPATKNRYLALLKLTFRLGEVNGKIKINPARLVRTRIENNAIVRYLNQYDPLPTKLRYLRAHKDEESRLRAVIAKRFPQHMPELDIALNTGMRRSEQYGLEWMNVDLENRVLTIPRAKSGKDEAYSVERNRDRNPPRPTAKHGKEQSGLPKQEAAGGAGKQPPLVQTSRRGGRSAELHMALIAPYVLQPPRPIWNGPTDGARTFGSLHYRNGCQVCSSRAKAYLGCDRETDVLCSWPPQNGRRAEIAFVVSFRYGLFRFQEPPKRPPAKSGSP